MGGMNRFRMKIYWKYDPRGELESVAASLKWKTLNDNLYFNPNFKSDIMLKVILLYFLIPLIVSVAAAVVFDLWKNRRRDFSISYKVVSKRRYKATENGDVKIALSYKGQVVESALAVFSFQLLNSGKKDIFFSRHFTTPVRISYPGWHFINVLILDNESRVNPIISLNDDGTASVAWDILKKGEKVKIEIVALEEKDKDCAGKEGLSFDFRADCLDRFDDGSIRSRRVYKLIVGAVCIAMVGAFAIMPMRERVKMSILYDGVFYQDADVTYNRFTGSYDINTDGGCLKLDPNQLRCADVISIEPQSGTSDEIAMLVIMTILSVVYFFACLYVMRNKKILSVARRFLN